MKAEGVHRTVNTAMSEVVWRKGTGEAQIDLRELRHKLEFTSFPHPIPFHYGFDPMRRFEVCLVVFCTNTEPFLGVEVVFD